MAHDLIRKRRTADGTLSCYEKMPGKKEANSYRIVLFLRHVCYLPRTAEELEGGLCSETRADGMAKIPLKSLHLQGVMWPTDSRGGGE